VSLWRWAGAGYAFGIVYWAGQFSWLGYAFVTQGGIPPGLALAFYGIFVAFLACLPALAFAVVAAARRMKLSPVLTLPLAFGALDGLLGIWPFGGIGWGSLAGPQAQTLAAGLLLPVFGAPGLVTGMGLMGSAWATFVQRRGLGAPNRSWAAMGALGALTIALCIAWPLDWEHGGWFEGSPRPTKAEASTRSPSGGAEFRALLVPGNLTLRELWASDGKPDSARYYLAETLRFFSTHPAAPAPSAPPEPGVPMRPILVIWPESAAMQPLTQGRSLVELSQVGTALGADFLAGSDAADPGRPANALFLVTGGRFDFVRYDKRRLVPFGEYVPRGFGCLFGHKVTAGDQDYVPGTQPPVLDWHGVRLGVAICFESILPEHARQAVHAGAEALVVAANAAWLPAFAQAEHLQLTALRSREVGRDALFVSNGGPSAHLRDGRALARIETGGPAVEVHPRLDSAVTPWTRWGLWGFAGCCLALIGATLVVNHVRHRHLP
jgi:apolipoprotein N-acyltransferase